MSVVPLRLALVVPSLELGGGVPSVAKFVLRTALDHGVKVKLISLATSSVDPANSHLLQWRSWIKGPSVRHGQWQGYPFVHLGAALGEFEFQRYRRRSILTHAVADCDVVQVVAGSPAWANALVDCHKPVALQVATRAIVERRRRDARPRAVAGWWRKAMTEITNRLDDRALQLVDAIQLENPWMLEYSRQINAGRAQVDIRYAPPGVDTVRFCPSPTRDLGTAPYILCVGRLDDPRKSVDLLLDAFAQMPAHLGRVKLVTAGLGKPPVAYWERAKSLGLQNRVVHVHRPTTEELVKLYQGATAFCLTSNEEGLGIVILEAMACGIPVVATRCGGPDGIIQEGHDGYLCSLIDGQEIGNRLAQLCSEPALNLRMGQAARRTICARYANEVTGKGFVDTWQRLAARRT